MKNGIAYSDKLVEISHDSILVRDYYYPFGDKRVEFKDIESIVVQNPSLSSGKYRYYGTGDFRTWFPPDNRSSRDRIFIIKLWGKWWRIGLTVEDSQAVLDLFRDKCSLVDLSSEANPS